MESLTQLAFDAAPIGIVLTENRIIKTCNSTFCDMTGFQRAELLGHSFRKLYSSDAEFDRVRDIGLQALRKGEQYSDLRLLRCANGEDVWCRFRALTFSRLPEAPDVPTLTRRERDVVQGLRAGRTSKQIAATLGLSTRTVEDVRARLLKKFRATTTHEVVGKFTSLEN